MSQKSKRIGKKNLDDNSPIHSPPKKRIKIDSDVQNGEINSEWDNSKNV